MISTKEVGSVVLLVLSRKNSPGKRSSVPSVSSAGEHWMSSLIAALRPIRTDGRTAVQFGFSRHIIAALIVLCQRSMMPLLWGR
jgi:hypothetical protein